MKAFIVEILVPDEYSQQDVLISCNVGLREFNKSQVLQGGGVLPDVAGRRLKPLIALDYNTRILSELQLKEPE